MRIVPKRATQYTMNIRHQALVVFVSGSTVLLQDRSNIANSPYLEVGHWSGSINEEETAVQAAIRTIKLDLNLELKPRDLQYLGEYEDVWKDTEIRRSVFVCKLELDQHTYQPRESMQTASMSIANAIDRLYLATDKQILIDLHAKNSRSKVQV